MPQKKRQTDKQTDHADRRVHWDGEVFKKPHCTNRRWPSSAHHVVFPSIGLGPHCTSRDSDRTAHGEGQTETETDRQTDTDTDTDTDTNTNTDTRHPTPNTRQTHRHTDTQTHRHRDTETPRQRLNQPQVNTSKDGPQARGWAIRHSRQVARCTEPKQKLNLYSPIEAPRRGEDLGKQPVVPKQEVSVARVCKGLDSNSRVSCEAGCDHFR